MLSRCFLVLGVLTLFSCSSENDGGPDSGSSDDAGTSSALTLPTCMDILSCLAECPDTDEACPDTCFNAGSSTAQDQLLALLTCMDQKQCTEVTCIENQCSTELTVCLNSSTTDVGTANTMGTIPPGNIPAELVGHWVRPGADEVVDFTFGVDGSAMYSRYKESGIGTCDMSVNSEWKTGSVVANGDVLTITLAPGTTTVVWLGGCGSNYQNPAEGKRFELRYELDATAEVPGIYLTDLHCTGEFCTERYQKN